MTSVDPLRRDAHHAWTSLAEVGLRHVVAAPARPGGLTGWVPVIRLHRTQTWRVIADAYSDDLGTAHRAVGAACGLQHYCGRLASAVLGVWVQTGAVLCLDADRWWAYLDSAGHTDAVDTDPEVGRRDASLAAGRLTALADVVLTGATWGTGRALVTCRSEPGPYGTRLVHERHTCCLIRLGHEHPTCGTCPQQPACERRRAAREVASMPVPERRLTARFPA